MSGPSVTANLAALNFLGVGVVADDCVFLDDDAKDFGNNCDVFNAAVACGFGASSQNHGIFVVSENKCVLPLLPCAFEFPCLFLFIPHSIFVSTNILSHVLNVGLGADIRTPETTEKPSV